MPVNTPQLSVVVPVYNERENIRPLVTEIDAALSPDIAHEIIYVNDGSSDGTLDELLSLRTDFPALRVLSHAHSCGQSTAVRSGIKAARGAWIATLDGDGQNDPADIPAMLALALDEGNEFSLIAGWRHQRKDTWFVRLMSKIANGVRRRILKDNTPDTGCGLKVFRRDVFLELPYFNHMHRYLPALFHRAGHSTHSHPVNHRNREHGQSKYGLNNRLWVGIVDLFGVGWLQRRAKLPQIKEHGE